MAIQSRSLTYEDSKQERETRDERLELIEGEIVVTPSPSLMHQIVVHRLYVLLDRRDRRGWSWAGHRRSI